ncbi:uncharacterized protein LOC124142188 [Haliotis rufescens]|uniref:uncharacterized protein LOC124142188 n=1 Tax=Haliotis rufescens TaxID=6454 RepID=UPI00201E7B81|nr:uncharacterized protein LOC124142188 [Haliotis rufescens]
MLQVAVFIGCVAMVLCDSQRLSDDASINVLRSIRRLKTIQRRNMEQPSEALKQRKDTGDLLTCNACSFSSETKNCVYVDEVCSPGQICADIWRSEGRNRNYNGCINPDLCAMIKEAKDTTYVRVSCCLTDLCNW